MVGAAAAFVGGLRDPFGRPARTEARTASSARDDAAWADAGEPAFYRINATLDQAGLLGIPAGEPLLVRAVTQQSGGLRRASHLYMPFSVVAGTPWADNPHLPPARQLHEHLAGTGLTLTWTERVRARMPVGDETTSLEVPPGVPLLIVLRLTQARGDDGATAAPLALEEIRHRGDQTELAYPLA